MRILWIKAGGLVPPDTGGKIRSYHIVQELAKKHAVTLFNFYVAHWNDIHPSLQGRFERVVCWPLEIPTGRSFQELLNYIRQLPSGRPFSVAKYCRANVAHGLKELLSIELYDVMVCDFMVSCGIVPWDVSCPKVLFTHNVEALIWQRHYKSTKNPAWKLVSWLEYQRIKRFEHFCLQKADHILTVSQADREAFTKIVDAGKITAIPTGVDTQYFQSSSCEEHPNSLVFTGSMDWMPNEDAIMYFGSAILPILRKLVPDVSLTVVGRNPSNRLCDSGSRWGIRVTGTVDDIRPHVQKAAVVIVPLRIGSGTRLKIFEAMAMGKAIVSTTIGAEGLPVTDNENILLADSPAEFADKVAGLLRDTSRRHQMGSAARGLVVREYSWESVAAVLDAVLQRVAGKSSPANADQVRAEAVRRP